MCCLATEILDCNVDYELFSYTNHEKNHENCLATKSIIEKSYIKHLLKKSSAFDSKYGAKKIWSWMRRDISLMSLVTNIGVEKWKARKAQDLTVCRKMYHIIFNLKAGDEQQQKDPSNFQHTEEAPITKKKTGLALQSFVIARWCVTQHLKLNEMQHEMNQMLLTNHWDHYTTNILAYKSS